MASEEPQQQSHGSPPSGPHADAVPPESNNHPDSDDQPSKFLLPLLVVMVCVFFGLPYGAVGLQPALLARGMFAAYCAADEHHRPCREQLVYMAQVMQLTIGSILAFPGGTWTDRLGPHPVIRGAVVVFASGFGLCGIEVQYGWPFAVGYILIDAAGNTLLTAVLSGVIPLVASDDPKMRSRWSGIVTGCSEVGFFLVYPIAQLFAWRLLPLWLWLVAFGATMAIIFLPLAEAFIAPLQLRRSATEHGEDDDTGGRCSDHVSALFSTLAIPDVWVAIPQVIVAAVITRSFVSAAGQIAIFFNASPSAGATMVPFAGGAMGLLGIAIARTKLGEDLYATSATRVISLLGAVILLTLPACRTPVGFFFGLCFVLYYRLGSWTFAAQASNWIGHGGTQARTFSVVLLSNAIAQLAFGQFATYYLGHSPRSFMIVLLTLSGLCVLSEFLCGPLCALAMQFFLGAPPKLWVALAAGAFVNFILLASGVVDHQVTTAIGSNMKPLPVS